MMGLSDNERISMTGSAVLTQYTRDRCTDYGISVVHDIRAIQHRPTDIRKNE